MAMVFLGSSQTFIGTLATLAILCILFNDSNFIYRILGEIKNNFTDDINRLRKEANFDDVIQSPEYKQLNDYIQNNNDELKDEGVKLMSQLNMLKLNVQMNYAPSEDEGRSFMGIIDSSNEQILSPFFTFIFCVILFLFDEVFIFLNPEYINCLYSTLVFFLLASFIFWGIIWIKYYIKYNKAYTEKSKAITNNFTYRNILHFTFYSLLFIFISCILYFSCIGNNYVLEFDVLVLKLFCQSFILLNGFVLPFYLPYIFYRKTYKTIKELVEESNEKISKTKEIIKESLHNYSGKLDKQKKSKMEKGLTLTIFHQLKEKNRR